MAAACWLLAAAYVVHAQEPFPNKPIRILVGFTPGSGTDFLARTVSQKLAESWGQSVVVDNRPGAGGVIASDLLKRSTPDGHSLMVVANGHAVNATLMSKLPYDTVRDFAGITYLADVPNVLVCSPALRLTSARGLIDLAKAKPGQMTYATAGVGSSTHVNTELFKLAAGIQVVHVPFKGAPEVLSNVISADVQFAFSPISSVAPFVTAGRLTGLALSSKDRSPVLPNVPTLAESGLPGFDFSGWYGMFAPASTPKGGKGPAFPGDRQDTGSA
jgi:tripartite-type tricarboxylate transporter receptor subunit TctC